MTTLNDEIESLLISKGASLFDFADLQELPSKDRDGLPFGISFAVALDPDIIAGISDGPTKEYMENLGRVDNLLQEIGEITVKNLREKGHKAHPHTTPGIENHDTLINKLPQKTVATRAGLGWIGKCALLITPEFGSAVRLGSVLTNAKVDIGVSMNQSQCDNCTACISVCPAEAITGEEWHTGVKRDTLINAFSCRQAARELLIKRTGSEVAGRTICGICITACPWTQQYLNKASKK